MMRVRCAGCIRWKRPGLYVKRTLLDLIIVVLLVLAMIVRLYN